MLAIFHCANYDIGAVRFFEGFTCVIPRVMTARAS